MSTEDPLMVGLDRLIGTEFQDFDPEGASARLAVADELLQPFGVVHGGVLSALAESLVSRATYESVKEDGLVALGQSTTMNFLRPITEGHINATARAKHRGTATWLWDVEITDDAGQLCALAQMRIAVRPATRDSGS